jgi:cell division septation protein DedD
MLDRQAASRRRFIWLTILNVALTAVAAAAYAVFSDIGPPHFGSQTASLSVSATLAKLPLPPASSAQVLPVPALTVSAPNPAIVSSAPASLISTPLAIVKDVNAVPCKDCVRDAIASAGASTQGVGKPDTLKPVSEHASKAVMDTRAAAFSSYVPRRPLAASSTEPKVTNPPANKLTASKPYFINVGVFADDTNARNAYTKLLASGLTAYKQELNTAKGKRTRVRVGPFDTRSEADTAAKKILALKLDAMVSRQ